jgi:uncharacterized metal-binding protein YceD (DUF177 family)
MQYIHSRLKRLTCHQMKIPVDEISPSAKEIRFLERIEDLNEIYASTQVRDFEFPPCLDVHLVYYRSGEDIFFRGAFGGDFTASCGRCLTSYSFHLAKGFDFVLSPDPAGCERKAEALRSDELGLSYYSTEEIDLAPLIKEQVLLALPTRPLCGEECRGLCGGCGVNLNSEKCVCDALPGDPRMELFRTLKINR